MAGNSAIHVSVANIEEPYAGMIKDFLVREFPGLNANDKESILEAVMAEIIGSGQVRYGPQPNPESQVAMRALVRKCIEENKPIPVLVPAGPKKTPINKSIDLAELSALRTLACLRTRVMAHYSPGLLFNMRLEDATGWYLEDDVPGARESMEVYLGDLEKLIRILGYSDFINPVRESAIVSGDELASTANAIIPALKAYIEETDQKGLEGYEKLDTWKALSALGWQGNIPLIQREYYHQRFGRLFPEMSPADRIKLMTKYLAVTLARYKLRATGVSKDWNGHFQLNFAPPIPGIPSSMVSTRIHYRTVPLRFTKMHMPFWRAKGYLKVNGEVAISLASWKELLNYNECSVTFHNERESVKVQSDYIIV